MNELEVTEEFQIIDVTISLYGRYSFNSPHSTPHPAQASLSDSIL